MFREINGMRSKVARYTPQQIKTKTVATPPEVAQSKADSLGDASKA